MQGVVAVHFREDGDQPHDEPIVGDSLDDDGSLAEKERLRDRVPESGLDREQRIPVASGSEIVRDAGLPRLRPPQVYGPYALKVIAVNEEWQVGAIKKLIVTRYSLKLVFDSISGSTEARIQQNQDLRR